MANQNEYNENVNYVVDEMMDNAPDLDLNSFLTDFEKMDVPSHAEPSGDYFLAQMSEYDLNYNLKQVSMIYEYYNIAKDSVNNRASYEYLNYHVPYGVYYKTFSLFTNSIQPSGFINMKNIIGKNIVVTMNDNYKDDYYNSKNNPYNQGIEFKILYTKYNIANVKNGSLELQFYN